MTNPRGRILAGMARLPLAALVALVLAGCLGGPESGEAEYEDIDVLMEDAAWSAVDILWGAYADLEQAEPRTVAVYYFLESGELSPLSEILVDGLTTKLANAFQEEGIPVRVLDRRNLDRILGELAFQSTDLVDPATQRAVGRQLGADLILTGNLAQVQERRKVNMQLIELESGVVLGGFLAYLTGE
jgi:TolB-like protein